ncbi:MAG: putative toxin-antitoxin system toxin component, PIN family [Gemmatimonadaceae bacterium]
MRVLLDTNVLVSAFATRGLCADVFRSVIAQHDLVVGEVVLDELRRVLTARFHAPAEKVRELEVYLRSYEVVAKPPEKDPVGVRDAADRWVLATAHHANVDVLITGDADLLAVAKQVRVRIITSRDFWGELRKPGAG